MNEPPGAWHVVSAAETRRLDALARAHGTLDEELVESAGRAAADWILANAPARRAVVCAGPGGNGADGLVVARHLAAGGTDVVSFLVADRVPLSASTRRALDRLVCAGGAVVTIHAAAPEPLDLGRLTQALDEAELTVDALYGSGLSRPLGGTAADVVGRINEAAREVVSLDVPSGLAAERGEVRGPAVRAEVTLAMQFLKPAHLLFPAAEWCGRTEVVPVAYPADVLAAAAPLAWVLAPPGARRRLPARPPTGHKGTFGHVVLVAGSAGMVGAAILAGRAALRAGAGLLTLAVPASQTPAVHAALPEALVVAAAEASGHLVPAAVPQLGSTLDRASVLALGPGLSRARAVAQTVAALIAAFRGPVIVDADALFALPCDAPSLRALAGRAVVTPHPGEFARLMGRDLCDEGEERMAAATGFAGEHEVIVLLKGRPTTVGFPDGRVYLNPTGNTGLATGGSGDVLTGLLAGLVASGASLEDAALVGPYVHGLAAELFAADRSERSLTPSDVIELLPRAFREVERCA